MDSKALLREALEARKTAYTPYSGFAVGAALLCKNGRVYRGCNIENVAYGPTNCAERTAFFKAVSEGEREFAAIAITGAPAESPEGGYAYPCGVCRQVMLEFCDAATFRVIVGAGPEDFEEYTLAELTPMAFSPRQFGRKE